MAALGIHVVEDAPLNNLAWDLVHQLLVELDEFRVEAVESDAPGIIVDFGVDVLGSLGAGIAPATAVPAPTEHAATTATGFGLFGPQYRNCPKNQGSSRRSDQNGQNSDQTKQANRAVEQRRAPICRDMWSHS